MGNSEFELLVDRVDGYSKLTAHACIPGGNVSITVDERLFYTSSPLNHRVTGELVGRITKIPECPSQTSTLILSTRGNQRNWEYAESGQSLRFSISQCLRVCLWSLSACTRMYHRNGNCIVGALLFTVARLKLARGETRRH